MRGNKLRASILFFILSVCSIVQAEDTSVTTYAESQNGVIRHTEPIKKTEALIPMQQPEKDDSPEETALTHIGGLLDQNETEEMLLPYINEMRKVVIQSVRKRQFGDSVACEPIEACLEKTEKYLLSGRGENPESRHISESLGRVYLELYEQTGSRPYLGKALDSYIFAEEMGIKHGGINARTSRYGDHVVYISSILNVPEKVENFFSMVLKAFPEDSFTNLYYAEVLSRSNDERADYFFEKAMSSEPSGPFDSALAYVEHLLDRKKYKEALTILNKVKTDSDKVDFFKGYVFEKLGNRSAAKKEYDKYLKKRKKSGSLQRFDKPEGKYRIPGSILQKGIEFDAAVSGDVSILADIRTTPCAATDWACKAYWYGVFR
jgi:tetratricopeptide (TPR) repeat protein